MMNPRHLSTMLVAVMLLLTTITYTSAAATGAAAASSPSVIWKTTANVNRSAPSIFATTHRSVVVYAGRDTEYQLFNIDAGTAPIVNVGFPDAGNCRANSGLVLLEGQYNTSVYNSENGKQEWTTGYGSSGDFNPFVNSHVAVTTGLSQGSNKETVFNANTGAKMTIGLGNPSAMYGSDVLIYALPAIFYGYTHMTAQNVTSGEIMWSKNYTDLMGPVVSISKPALFFGCEATKGDRSLNCAMNPLDGSLIWAVNITLPDDTYNCNFITLLGDDTVVSQCNSNTAPYPSTYVAQDAATGKQLWTRTFNNAFTESFVNDGKEFFYQAVIETNDPSSPTFGTGNITQVDKFGATRGVWPCKDMSNSYNIAMTYGAPDGAPGLIFVGPDKFLNFFAVQF